MAKMNCWEFKKCGRQPGGDKVGEFGVCVATTTEKMNMIHGGAKAGRVCWVVAGTLCGGKVQGSFAHKLANCMACEFYIKTKTEEGQSFKMAKELLEILKK